MLHDDLMSFKKLSVASESLPSPTAALAISDEANVASPTRKSPEMDDADIGDHLTDEEPDEDDGDKYRLTVNAPRPKKINERKRLDNAAFESWVIQNQREVASAAAANSKANLIERQSVSSLITYSEARKIIASPREYQMDLFQRAKHKNTIVVLDTGSGKTLIAALLLRHTLEQELENRAIGKPKKVAFFLVEKVALCLQQYNVLSQNLEYPVAKLYGAMPGMVNNKEFWDSQFSDSMVIVCTAQILLDCLTNGFIKIKQVNLLIFDEAHHTKKSHPYAKIIKNHYLREESKDRPRVLGMTASPVDTKTRDVQATAAELESILCSEIATVSDDVLTEQLSRRNQSEAIEYYERLEQPEVACTELWHKIAPLVQNDPDLRSAFDFARDAASVLGPWCADRWWKLQMTDVDVLKLESITMRNPGECSVSSENAVLTSVRQVQNIVQEHVLGPVNPDTPSLSSKVNGLWHVLNDSFSRGTDRCIVFVEKRSTAALLADLFSQPSMAIPGMTTSYMVGSQSTTFGLGTMSFRDQLVTLMKFRRGETNCLFATPVAEEGIDIPECDLIVRFDLFNSVIQYIQSKGRARQTNSRYISMVEDGNLKERHKIMQASRDATALRRFCSVLPADRKVDDVAAVAAAEYEFVAQKTHEIPSTGACLTLTSSLEVLARFSASLPFSHGLTREDYVITNIGKNFVADLILPDASPVKHVSGHPQRSKHLARCSAAYDACIQLLEKKYIDDHLQPVFAKKINAMRNARLAISSNKKSEYLMRTKPEAWTIGSSDAPDKLYATALVLRDAGVTERRTCPLVLLTRTRLPRLPEIPLFFGNGEATTACPVLSPATILASAKDIESLANFTLKIFADVFSKVYEAGPNDLPYFFAPCTASHEGLLSGATIDLDWALLKSVQAQEFLSWEGAPEDFFFDKLVIDPHDGSRKMIINGINKDLKPTDATPEGVPEPKCRAYRLGPQTIKEYSSSLWVQARKRVVWRDDQPVINAELLSLRRNLLDEDSAEFESKSPRRCYIILEPLKVSPLPADIVAMAMCIPAVLHRVESVLISMDSCALLGLSIRSDLALEAMTKDSDNTDEHGLAQFDFQSGMGNNYERLEFLGDSFLKMATTISLFTLFPEHDEAQNHDERMLLVCNQNLFNHAVDRNLFEYIRSRSFDRRTWYPNLQLRKGKGQPNKALRHSLADKTIADVCEALIGAAYLTDASGSMDMAVQAVTCFVKSKNHSMTTYEDYYACYQIPSWQSAPGSAAYFFAVDRVAELTGYKFNSANLMRSAFKHPSYPYEPIPHYQQLEFLGDALLDMTIVDHLFTTFPKADPQWLTEHKMAMVSNQFLGCLCIKLKLHKHILLTTSVILGHISQYVSDLEQAEREAKEVEELGESRRDFWLSASHPPKVLADVVEALIGAMFVDSKYDYGVVQRFFQAHVKPYFEDMRLYDTFAKKHPVTGLGRRMVELGCTQWRLCCTGVPSPGDDNVAAVMKEKDGQMICALVVHGQVLVHHTTKSGRYGKVRVAKMALERYANDQGWNQEKWRAETGCDCRVEDVVDGSPEDHGTAI